MTGVLVDYDARQAQRNALAIAFLTEEEREGLSVKSGT